MAFEVPGMHAAIPPEIRHRVQDRIDAWRIVVERLVETHTSILVFGRRQRQQVVLKVVRRLGEEWRSADVLDAFAGHTVVQLLERADGAVLLERLRPGHSLASLAVDGDDDRATAILAHVIGAMSARAPASDVPTVEDWGRAFERYVAGGDRRVPELLVQTAGHLYSRLCASQSTPRLLHGDLHHANVLLDARRGWLAIDPKGVVGEPEYEIGAALRNPYGRPDLFTDPARIARRVDRFARELRLDARRILAWAFAQAVLAAIWDVEDGGTVGPSHAWIVFAANVRPLLQRAGDACDAYGR